MVYFKYFNVKVPLEEFHLRGPLIFCGLSYESAQDVYKKIISSLKKEGIEVICFNDLIKYSSKFTVSPKSQAQDTVTSKIA